MRFPEYVEVVWEDALSTAEWVEWADLPDLARHVTRGWLIHKDKKKLTLAATLQVKGGDSLGEVVTIPAGDVVNFRVMRVKEPSVE